MNSFLLKLYIQDLHKKQSNSRNLESGIIMSQITKELLEIYGGCGKENKLVSRMWNLRDYTYSSIYFHPNSHADLTKWTQHKFVKTERKDKLVVKYRVITGVEGMQRDFIKTL